MFSKQVDGIIYIGCHSHALATFSLAEDTRIVCAYCYSEDPTIPAVIYDDREAARRVTEMLLAKGHTKIGIVAGRKDSWHTNNRLMGIQEALYEHAVPYNRTSSIMGIGAGIWGISMPLPCLTLESVPSLP